MTITVLVPTPVQQAGLRLIAAHLVLTPPQPRKANQ